ncbi:cytochrome c oxidase subunit II [Fimbriimonas ginsengisoli]|uniref:cytochrome-c oxidase n=1 Tax=Fimbriimonas ginsengisoli Gsoil 348 TaxID=661478 RepID=A0A068NQ93_FIMGI|nr:cytochrome c oxidase subunit II [Fimbriimonas ginsengisoli]AIE85556.1 cytochrome c oxidase subunit II [Fimbriimonas ginsengisoli Gsoil 348]
MFNFPLAPPSASNFAGEHDLVFYALCLLSLFFLVIVTVGIIAFSIRYRAGNKVDRSRPMYENLKIELTLTFVPLILGIGMFWLGARVFVEMRTPPKDAQEIFVVGKQWMWHIQHGNGVRENNTLHVPVGKPVKLTMISQDVIHGLYIPAFRVQMHVVPGRYTSLWFTATKAGEYHLFCSMYCGTQHSEMGGKVVAMEAGEYAKWLANGGMSVAPMSMEQAGQKIYNKVGCNNCHGETSTPRAPTLMGIYNTKRTFTDGSSLVANEEYLRESILRPYNHLTQGYDETMPAYDGQLTEGDVLNLIAYIKAMGTTAGSTTPTSIVNRRTAPTNATGQDVPDTLSVGAMQYNQEDPNATPTVRNNTPAVGAIAAEKGKNP